MKQEFYNLQINTDGQKLYEFTDQTIQWIEKNNKYIWFWDESNMQLGHIVEKTK